MANLSVLRDWCASTRRQPKLVGARCFRAQASLISRPKADVLAGCQTSVLGTIRLNQEQEPTMSTSSSGRAMLLPIGSARQAKRWLSYQEGGPYARL